MLELMRDIKKVFDPDNLMNPERSFHFNNHERRKTSQGAWNRPRHGVAAGRELRERGAHRQPALPRRQGPARGKDGKRPKGKLGREYTVEQGYEHARTVGLDLFR